jgi:hypothetical protein
MPPASTPNRPHALHMWEDTRSCGLSKSKGAARSGEGLALESVPPFAYLLRIMNYGGCYETRGLRGIADTRLASHVSLICHISHILGSLPTVHSPFHIAPRAGTPVAARFFSVGQSPVSAQAPPRLVGMDGCVDWAPVVRVLVMMMTPIGWFWQRALPMRLLRLLRRHSQVKAEAHLPLATCWW